MLGNTFQGVSSFVVEKGMKGFELGQKIEDKCGMRASMTAELVFSDVKCVDKTERQHCIQTLTHFHSIRRVPKEN